jgi:hypothetical protein
VDKRVFFRFSQRVTEGSFVTEEKATLRTALLWAISQLVVVMAYRSLTYWILDP